MLSWSSENFENLRKQERVISMVTSRRGSMGRGGTSEIDPFPIVDRKCVSSIKIYTVTVFLCVNY